MSKNMNDISSYGIFRDQIQTLHDKVKDLEMHNTRLKNERKKILQKLEEVQKENCLLRAGHEIGETCKPGLKVAYNLRKMQVKQQNELIENLFEYFSPGGTENDDEVYDEPDMPAPGPDVNYVGFLPAQHWDSGIVSSVASDAETIPKSSGPHRFQRIGCVRRPTGRFVHRNNEPLSRPADSSTSERNPGPPLPARNGSVKTTVQGVQVQDDAQASTSSNETASFTTDYGNVPGAFSFPNEGANSATCSQDSVKKIRRSKWPSLKI